MGQSPLAPHSSSAVELKDRIQAERRCSPFVVYRGVDGGQHIFDLGEAGDRVTIARRTSNPIALDWDDELSLSIDAVKTHLRALYRRFGIEQMPQNQKRARLAWDALQSGFISSRELWL